MALEETNRKTHQLASALSEHRVCGQGLWICCKARVSQSLSEFVRVCQSAQLSDAVRKRGHRHVYLLAIFLLIQGQTNIQTKAAQTIDPAKVMRKMAHTGSISIPSTTVHKHTHTHTHTHTHG